MRYYEDNNLVIDDNNKKYDILKSWHIDSQFSILITKKRFLNIFKNHINLGEQINIINLFLYVRLYLNSPQSENPIIEINKLYSIYGLHNNELIDFNETIKIMDAYKVMNVLIGD